MSAMTEDADLLQTEHRSYIANATLVG
jgi:hypothetical protein